MPRYKVGEVIVVGSVEAIVVHGNCESCFFNNKKEEASCIGAESCIDDIGLNHCYKVLDKGL